MTRPTTTPQDRASQDARNPSPPSTTTVASIAHQDVGTQPPPSRLRRGLLALVAAISLSFVAFIVDRDSGPDTESPLEDQPTVSVPAYTGDWKDLYVGRPTARSSYTGDWKDAFVGK